MLNDLKDVSAKTVGDPREDPCISDNKENEYKKFYELSVRGCLLSFLYFISG